MIDKLTGAMDFNAKALVLRAERQRLLASNIANADTPGYVARDFKFTEALQEATGAKETTLGTSLSNGAHLPLSTSASSGRATVDYGRLGYSVQSHPSVDGNSVDLDRERANFADNTVRYEATLRFINGQVKTMLSAITGQ